MQRTGCEVGAVGRKEMTMAEIVEFPDRMGNEETFELGGGSSVTIKAYAGESLTVERAVYMLEFVKSLVLKMMDA